MVQVVAHLRSYNAWLLIASGLFGAVLGLSAPGWEQWYIAWCGLAPLLVLVISASDSGEAALRGLFFGTVNYLVYFNWCLGVHPLDWLGFNTWQSILSAWAGWWVFALHQGILVGVFAFLCYVIPQNASCLPSKHGSSKSWRLPAMLVLPALWVVWMNRIGNAHILLGVPWGMLEYSQYKQHLVVQAASTIGGIGIGFIIVCVNTAIAIVILTVLNRMRHAYILDSPTIAPGYVRSVHGVSTFVDNSSITAGSVGSFAENPPSAPIQGTVPSRQLRKNKVESFSSGSIFGAICQLLVCVAVTIFALVRFGQPYVFSNDSMDQSDRSAQIVSVLQGDDDLRIAKAVPGLKANSELPPFFSMILKCPAGLCIGTESMLPLNVAGVPVAKEVLADVAKRLQKDVCVGCFDQDKSTGRQYNAACGVSATGEFVPTLYRKQYLVPFLEYTPTFFQLFKAFLPGLPEQWKMIDGFLSGTGPGILRLSRGTVAPLICFEVISPELAAASVRGGGQLLVALGDQAWFHDSMIGDQMIAFCVMRAVENHRYFVFASNTGPSVIIDPSGRILARSLHGKKEILTGKIRFLSEVTPFCRWYSLLGRL